MSYNLKSKASEKKQKKEILVRKLVLLLQQNRGVQETYLGYHQQNSNLQRKKNDNIKKPNFSI
ncbi:hypothetical protein [Neobacillus sp. LXY-4]|uniref:hypothetical protein n=1 Tax=Neobacillus sp. LXY-4 TaxID=3379826 RepID=UPI003EDEA164